MRKVFQTLDTRTNALLESPTGTGKTLSLLSSVLTWVSNNYIKKNFKTKVIYMSRTHSQLKQVHKELEKTCFRPNMAIFASRDQLCLKEEFSQLKGKEKVEACGKGVKLFRKIKK
jgi:regulator of telomere elongation helicase 1